MWFASISLLFIYFCFFMMFIWPRVILLLLNQDARHLAMYYEQGVINSRLLNALWEMFASGDTFRCVLNGIHYSTYHLKRFICVRAVSVFVCTQEWRFACSGVCMHPCWLYSITLCSSIRYLCMQASFWTPIWSSSWQLYPASYGTQNHLLRFPSTT